MRSGWVRVKKEVGGRVEVKRIRFAYEQGGRLADLWISTSMEAASDE